MLQKFSISQQQAPHKKFINVIHTEEINSISMTEAQKKTTVYRCSFRYTCSAQKT